MTRKLLVLPVAIGTVTYSTDDVISVAGDHIRRDAIVGRQPEKHEHVLVLDVQDLIDALRADTAQEQDDDGSEVLDYELNATVVAESPKAVYFDVGDNRISLPKRYVNAQLGEFVRIARLPRWLALDRGL